MKTCFVTGAGGFVGSHLVDHLLSEGWGVRALIRDPPCARWLPAGGVEVVRGDVHDEAALGRGAKGVDVVFHVAGISRGSRSELERVNVEGTASVLHTCFAGDTPAKLVYVSSQAAAGPSPNGTPIDEGAEPRPLSLYGRSKLAAERVIEEQAGDLPFAIVRPPSVYGPRDVAFLSLFRMAARGAVPLPRGLRRLAIVHAEDLALGLRLAAERGKGIYYLTDGQQHEGTAVGDAIAAAVSARARVLRLPGGLFAAAAFVSEQSARVTGRRAPLTADRLRDALAPDWSCSDARARGELGYESRRELRAAMRETAEWYRQEGWL